MRGEHASRPPIPREFIWRLLTLGLRRGLISMLEGSPAPQRPIVLIDDDEDAHFFFVRALKAAKLTRPVRFFWSGNDALPYFQDCAAGREPWPFVVFLDIRMAGMSGFDVLTWLRDHQMLGKMVVAMSSSSDEPADVSRSFALGAHAYVGKAPNVETLAKLMREALLFG